MFSFLFILIFGSTSAVQGFTPTYDYCDTHLCRVTMHIGCDHDMKFSANCSVDAKIVPLEEDSIEFILKTHNQFRNQIAHGGFSGFSPATRMATIVWNDELAYLASLNVRQCSTSHDKCRNTKQFPIVGQNLAYKGYSGKAPKMNTIIESQIRLWFDEYKHITMESIIAFKIHKSDAPAMNFAQLVQEKATHVGCSVLLQNHNDWLQQFLTCNYAHGNQIGRPVYSSGAKAASDCKTGTNPAYTSLCSINEHYSMIRDDKDSDKIAGGNIMTTKKTDVTNIANDGHRTKNNPKKGTPFDNLLQQIGNNLDKFCALNITVNTFGHEQVSVNRVKFDNRDSKKEKARKEDKKHRHHDDDKSDERNKKEKKNKRKKKKHIEKEEDQLE